MRTARTARSAKRPAWLQGKLERIGDFYLAPGYSTEFMAVFLATELRDDPLKADEDEFLQG